MEKNFPVAQHFHLGDLLQTHVQVGLHSLVLPF